MRKIAIAVMVAVMVATGTRSASAEPITLFVGTLSFDVFLLGGSNAFNINNFTGDQTLDTGDPLLDHGLLPALTFESLTLSLSGQDASANPLSLYLDLGDLGPGPLLDSGGNTPFALQFAPTTSFTSARLQAAFSPGSFPLANGLLFTPDSFSFDVPLLPADVSGFLIPGLDFTPIELAGQTSAVDTVATPEPATLTLVASGLAGLLAHRRRRARVQQRSV